MGPVQRSGGLSPRLKLSFQEFEDRENEKNEARCSTDEQLNTAEVKSLIPSGHVSISVQKDKEQSSESAINKRRAGVQISGLDVMPGSECMCPTYIVHVCESVVEISYEESTT